MRACVSTPERCVGGGLHSSKKKLSCKRKQLSEEFLLAFLIILMTSWIHLSHSIAPSRIPLSMGHKIGKVWCNEFLQMRRVSEKKEEKRKTEVAALFTLMIIIVINLAVGILPYVDNFAHIRGFLTGFLLGFLLLLRPQFGWPKHQHLQVDARVKSKHTIFKYVLLVVALVLLIVGRQSCCVMGWDIYQRSKTWFL